MKNFCKILLAIALSVCFAVPFIGCETYSDKDNCGGIVDSVEITEVYVSANDYDWIGVQYEEGYYPAAKISFIESLTVPYSPCVEVYKSDFADYNCQNLNDLLTNTNAIMAFKERHYLMLAGNQTPTTCTFTNGMDNLAYYLFYDGYEEYTQDYEISDFTNYIGWIKF